MSPEQSIWSPSATRIRTAAKSASPIIGATLVGLATPIVQGDPCVLHRAFGRVRIPVEGSPIAILQAEVNSSPGTDLIVLSRLQTNSPSDLGARPLLNEGNGRFSFTARNLGRCGSAPAAFTKADFNNDGWIDLASTCPETGPWCRCPRERSAGSNSSHRRFQPRSASFASTSCVALPAGKMRKRCRPGACGKNSSSDDADAGGGGSR